MNVEARILHRCRTEVSVVKIGIVGKGNVGSALGRGLERAGHEVRFLSKEPAALRDVATTSELLILAVPFSALEDVVTKLEGAADNKPLVDVSNVLDENMELALGFATSGAEELQKRLARAHVVKAFNTVFARNMETGRVHDERLCAFVAGDQADSKAAVLRIAGDIGFDAIDAGPLKSARLLEPLGVLNIKLGYELRLGTEIGLRLVR